MRKSLYLLLSGLPLFFVGGVSGSYLIKTLSVLCFVAGALSVLWVAIHQAVEDESRDNNSSDPD
jgi:hypothetical protein